ncbi:probable NADPH-dependent aldose reductase GRE3 [Nakaseomyces glabratus]|nr:probable NADPH-dependent aldose reductase GRE3 [Nakaseomyces glabratus]SLM15949.1 probable NADPH-dependent aldose reductase GRE3 [Nakaseomyces glabratus]
MSSVVTLNNGLKMPLVGLGCWKIPNDVCAQQVYDAIKIGYRLFDGAEDYGNEKEVGQGIRKAIDEDYLDLFYIHFPIAFKYVPFEEKYPPGFYTGKEDEKNGHITEAHVPIIDTYRALEQCVEEGLIKSIGISNFSGSLVQDLLRQCKIKPVALQVEHHPYLTQEHLVEYCKDNGIQVVAYSSFGPQSYIELNHPLAKNTPNLFHHDTIKQIANNHNVATSQVLLRWATQRGIAIIPKSSKKERLQDNLMIDEKLTLTHKELEAISKLNKNLRLNDPWDWLDANYHHIDCAKTILSLRLCRYMVLAHIRLHSFVRPHDYFRGSRVKVKN